MADEKLDKSFEFLHKEITSSVERRILDLADQGWEAFYSEIFGKHIVDGFGSDLTDDLFHADAINWHWEARLALLQGSRPPNDWFVYLPTWPRGYGKSSVGRMMLITDAMLTFAHGGRGYALIPGGTKNKIKTHAASIESMLVSSKVVEYCPALARVKKSMVGRSRGWTASYMETDAKYVFHFVGLEEGMAGANLEGVRPSFIMPDDIDGRSDSPVEAETKYRVLTSEVLPSKQDDTLVFWAQNIISRMSVRYRVEKQHVKILTNRKPTEAIPAVRGLAWERRTGTDGIIKDIVTAGRCTWKNWNLQRIQDEINTYGIDAFQREMQHEVEAPIEGLLMKNWQDHIHVISESEFESVFWTRTMPERWPKEWGNDWARTKTARHANVALWRTVSSANSPLPGCTFIFHPMSFEANAQVEDVAARLLACLSPTVTVENDRQMTWDALRREELIREDALSHTTTQLERINYERDVMMRLMPKYVEPLLAKHHVLGGVNSHEREDIREIFNQVYAMRCVGVNPGKFGGIEQLNRDMQVDITMPHAFRPDQMGYTRFYVVAPDSDEAEPRYVKIGTPGMEREIAVFPPKSFSDLTSPERLHDHELYRYQMINWRVIPAAVTVTGEIIDRPEKANDDFGNLHQMLAIQGPLQNVRLTPEEEFEELIPEYVRNLQDQPMTRQNQHRIEAAAMFARMQLMDKYGDDFLDDDLPY